MSNIRGAFVSSVAVDAVGDHTVSMSFSVPSGQLFDGVFGFFANAPSANVPPVLVLVKDGYYFCSISPPNSVAARVSQAEAVNVLLGPGNYSTLWQTAPYTGDSASIMRGGILIRG